MEFRKFGRKEHDATLAKWEAEGEVAELFPGEVARKFAWVGAAIDDEEKAGAHRMLAYGIFQPESDIAIATCELVLSDRGLIAGKWLKLLNIVVSPEIDNALRSEDMFATDLAVSAYKTAVLGAFSERLNHEADTLKLYGRSDELLRFFMILLVTINQDSKSPLRARKEGRWIVITTENGK